MAFDAEASAPATGDAEPDTAAILAEAKQAYELCVEREAHNREEALEDLRFGRMDDQWPEDIRRQREIDGRPCLTMNKLNPMIKQVVNDGRQNRPAIIFHPVGQGAEAETAEVLNGLVRNIEVISDADTAYDTALEFSCASGLGYLKVNTRYSDDDTFDQDIVIERVANPFAIYGDPHSMAADSSDWNIAFECDWITRDEFSRRFKDAQAVDWDELGYTQLAAEWINEERVLLCAYWKREPTTRAIVGLSDGSIVSLDEYRQHKDEFDAAQPPVTVIGRPRMVQSHKVTQYILTGAEVLETVAWAGKYIPIVPVYGDEVVIEGKRFFRSMIRGAKDAQRMFNYSRSAEVEATALAPKTPFIGKVGAFNTDIDKWETANTANHAFIEYDGQEAPQRQPFAGPPTGWMQQSTSAAQDIRDTIGLQQASMGEESNEKSGRAILARQREGDVSSFHFIDNQSRAIRHMGRIIVDLVPSIYSTPRVLRVMGVDRKPAQVAVNQPVGPDGQPAPQPVVDPISGQAMTPTKIFDLTAGKYDVTVEAGPSFTTRREEAANQMIMVMQADPALAAPMLPIVAKNLDWPGSEEIAQMASSLPQGGKDAKPDPAADAQAMQAKIAAEGQAKQAQLEAESQLKRQAAQHDQQLKEQAQAHDFALAQAKGQQDLQLAREKMAGEHQLKREAAAQDLQLQRESIALDAQVKATEAAHRLQQTAQMPDIQVGGGVG